MGRSSASRARADRWWTLVAPWYDRVVALTGWHRLLERLVEDVSSGTVVEVGCGPAHLAPLLARRGVRYVGVDRNDAMLQQARGTGARGGSRPVLVRADAAALPFRSGSADVVAVAGVLALLPVTERRAALRELARVSRGSVRLLEPVDRPGERPRRWRWWIVALVRDRPVSLAELAEAGLPARLRGRPRLAGTYSDVRADPTRPGATGTPQLRADG